MSTVGIITNTVTWFELQPERTKRRVKRDDLDALTEIYTGPSAYEDTFVPMVGSQHPDYNLMRVISTSVKRLPAAMTEVTVNYQGKLANGSSYTSVPTVNKYWMEGEVTYQTNGSSGMSQPVTFAGQTKWVTFSQPGIVSWTRRYTGRCVELAYITNNVPTGEPTRVGESTGFLGFENIWDVMSGFSGGMQISGGGGIITKMACTDVRVDDRADGWYQVNETYQSKMYPGPAGYQYAAGGVTGTASNKLISADTSSGNSADNQQPDPSTLAFPEGGNSPQGTAQQNANSNNFTFGGSSAGSVGQDTFQSTGMDPAWGQLDSGSANAAQVYPTISNDSATPANPDVGATSQAYSG